MLSQQKHCLPPVFLSFSGVSMSSFPPWKLMESFHPDSKMLSQQKHCLPFNHLCFIDEMLSLSQYSVISTSASFSTGLSSSFLSFMSYLLSACSSLLSKVSSS